MNSSLVYALCGAVSITAIGSVATLRHSRPEPAPLPPVFVIPPIVSASLASPSPALLQDDFDGENEGIPTLMYARFRQWEVVGGTVDLVGANSDWDFLPGNGLYVDLDGDRPDHVHFESGALVSRQSFALEPGDYALSFRLAGSHRGDVNTTTVSLGNAFREEITLPPEAPFRVFTRTIHVRRPVVARLRFENAGADGFGLLLDNVKLFRAADASQRRVAG
ncbi:hypothetical protein [Longimicrobium sp.]|uniref:hypothetical protein n=1 Tax=Longimicrobium sp. TaxID=2029185 RepID=UPI002D013BD3|nr:hypothetical protein [Longimicrobium sp.]HSU18048.1 hypothetical protein [Longimicrobium sp.]